MLAHNKAVEEKIVGHSDTELPAVEVDPTIIPVHNEHSEPGATAEADEYDLKEYDLKEFDASELDKTQYEFGAYDEYDNVAPNHKSTYEDEFEHAVPAETGKEEAQVRTDVSIIFA